MNNNVDKAIYIKLKVRLSDLMVKTVPKTNQICVSVRSNKKTVKNLKILSVNV